MLLVAAASGARTSPHAVPTAARTPLQPPSSGSSVTGASLGVWHLQTSAVDSNFQTGDFNAPNRVVLTRQGGDVTADRANGNYIRQVATLYGDVVMHDMNGSFAGMASTSATQQRGPATLTTDQLQIDWRARLYTAVGHVHYVQEATTVDADRGMLNDSAHMLYLTGDARVTQGARSLLAQRIAYNTITGDAKAEGNVTIQFPSPSQLHVATPKPVRIPGIHRTPSPR